MIAKLAIVEEEADESIYGLELLVEYKLIPEQLLNDQMTKFNEIVASQKTLRANNQKSKI